MNVENMLLHLALHPWDGELRAVTSDLLEDYSKPEQATRLRTALQAVVPLSENRVLFQTRAGAIYWKLEHASCILPWNWLIGVLQRDEWDALHSWLKNPAGPYPTQEQAATVLLQSPFWTTEERIIIDNFRSGMRVLERNFQPIDGNCQLRGQGQTLYLTRSITAGMDIPDTRYRYGYPS